MAINMMCTNSECKHYWEDNCMRNIYEERIEIDGNGMCITFENGVNELYKLDENLDLINSMKFIEDDADGEVCTVVIVEDNKINRQILAKVGIDDDYIKREDLIDENGYINVAPIAFQYCNWWNGDGQYFEIIGCDTCGVYMDKNEYQRNNGICQECGNDMEE